MSIWVSQPNLKMTLKMLWNLSFQGVGE